MGSLSPTSLSLVFLSIFKSPLYRLTLLMDLVIVSSDHPFGQCVRVISQGAAQERKTEHDPNGISPARVLRRPARSSSLYTAYEKREESHTCPSKRRRPQRHFISCHERSNLAKYEDHSMHIPKERRRKPGTRKKTTQIVPVSKEEAPFSSITPTCSRIRGEHGEMLAASSDIIPGSLLLSLARKSIDREMEWFGQKRCLMDVILDSRDSARRSTEAHMSRSAVAAGVGQFSRRDLHLLHRTYTFRDQSSLDVYWNDQAAILTGSIWLNDKVGNNGFPVSVERSTAGWPSEVKSS